MKTKTYTTWTVNIAREEGDEWEDVSYGAHGQLRFRPQHVTVIIDHDDSGVPYVRRADAWGLRVLKNGSLSETKHETWYTSVSTNTFHGDFVPGWLQKITADALASVQGLAGAQTV